MGVALLDLVETALRVAKQAWGKRVAFAPDDSVTVAEKGVLLRPAAVREFDVVPSLPE